MKKCFILLFKPLLLATLLLYTTDCSSGGKPVNGPQQVGPLKISIVDTAKYTLWEWPSSIYPGASSGSQWGWGITVRIVNTTDREVTEYIRSDSLLELTNDLNKRYVPLRNFLPIVDLKEFNGQPLRSEWFFSNTGLEFSTQIFHADTALGSVGSMIEAKDDKMVKTFLILKLPFKKSMTLVLVFDSPKESKPRTLDWPNAKPFYLK